MLRNQKEPCGFWDPRWELVVMAGDLAAHGGDGEEVADIKVVEDDIAGLGVSFWAGVADTSKDLWHGDVVMVATAAVAATILSLSWKIKMNYNNANQQTQSVYL